MNCFKLVVAKISTIIASQIPVGAWYEAIADQTVADAIMDRIIHGANKIQLKGESMRKRKNIWKKRKTKESKNHLQCKDIISFFAK